ncbi:hypothetical protein T492DRAFT_869833 [Pavlovales sp. CCMP2436]|nr:hypothetical protein T492DRAFT_869833 [Pavlovales sp. CCMP2436]
MSANILQVLGRGGERVTGRHHAVMHNLTVLMRGIWPAVPPAVATGECDAADSLAKLELPQHRATGGPFGVPASRAARRFDILMSEGEESDDPDELPTRYAEFESSKGDERVLCPICLKKFNERKLRAADRRDEWLVMWKNSYPTSKNTWEQFSHFMTSEFRDLANDLKRRATGVPLIVDTDEDDK